jgi:hypothetical protein
MATLIEAALRVIKRIAPVYYGTATGGSTTTLIDTLNTEQQGFYDNGIIWLLTGSNPGEWVDILSFGNGTFTFKSAVTPTIAAGDKYACITSDWERKDLRSAVNEACKSISKIYASDATLIVVANQEEYSLPSGVSDVRIIEIAENTTSPYGYVDNPYWREGAGKIYFHTDHVPDQAAGNKIRLWYAKEHADLDDTTSLYWSIDDMQWAAVIYLLQQKNIKSMDDDWVKDLYDKAQIENAIAMRRLKRPPSRHVYPIGPFG